MDEGKSVAAVGIAVSLLSLPFCAEL